MTKTILCTVIVGIFLLFITPVSNIAIAQEVDITVDQDTIEIPLDPDFASVRADRIPRRTRAIVNATVSEAGYYKIFIDILNTIEQLNETYYLTVEHPGGNEAPLCDPNLAAWKVVPDTTLDDPTGLRYAGMFYFEEGINSIILNHYAKIALQHPKFWAGPSDSLSIESKPESVDAVNMRLERADERYDLALIYTAQTDTSLEINGNLEQVEEVGETYTYELTISNIGANTANDVLIWLVPPDSSNLFNFNIPPDYNSADSLFWTFNQITPSQQIDITFQAIITNTIPTSPFQLFSESMIIAGCDTNMTNNAADVTIYAIDPFDYFAADLAVVQSAQTQTNVEINGQLEQAEFVGETYAYELVLSNQGPNDASSFVLWIFQPDSVQLSNFSIQANSTSGDTLFWNFDGIANSQQIDITFDAAVADSLPSTPFELVLESNVVYPYDTNTSNNSALNSIFAIDPFNFFAADIAISQSAQTDTSVEINGQLEQAQFIGENYSYELHLSNLGPNDANNVDLWIIQPDSVQLVNFNIQPDSTSGDTLLWHFNEIANSQQIDIIFQANISSSIPSAPFPLFLESNATYQFDTNTSNNSAGNTVFAIDPFDYFGADIAISQSAQTDTSVEINGQLEQAQFIGEMYSYLLTLSNQGPNLANEVELWIIPPDFVQLVNFNIQPGSTSADTLFWTFNEIANSQQIDITFQANISNSIPIAPLQLLLESNTTYQFDTNPSNNSAQNTVFAIDPFDYFGADIAVSQSAQTDTSVEINGQPEQAQFIGEIYSYELNLSNQGPNSANDVILWTIQPDSVQLSNFDIQPNSTSGDTLFWNFNEIIPGQQINITFEAKIADSLPFSPFQLFLESNASYPYDTNTSNNSDQNTVFALDPFNLFGADIAISQSAQTDTSVEINGQLEQAEFVGGIYSYELNLSNQGPNVANNVLLWIVQPVSVQLLNFNIEPNSTSSDTLFWTFNEITPSQQIDITFEARVANFLPSTPTQLILLSTANYQYDYNTSNNSDQNTVFAIDPFNYFGADIALSLSAQTDTSVEIDGQLEQAEFIGGTYSYEINLSNLGPKIANDVILWIVQPNLAQLFNFNIQPGFTSGDTLFWSFNEITPSQQIDITFEAKVADSTPTTLFQLLLESKAVYLFDPNISNNSAVSTVFAIDPLEYFGADIVFTLSAQTDTSLNINGNLEQVEPIGDIYFYELNLSNQGPNIANDVILWIVQPDSVQLFNFNIPPDSSSGDTLFWNFDEITLGQQIVITFEAQVADSFPTTPFELSLESGVIYPFDTDISNNSAQTSVFVIEPLDYFGADIAITHSTQTDTSVEINGQLEQAEFFGETYTNTLTVVNQGPNLAFDVVLWIVQPDSVRLFNFNIQPNSTSEDTLFWIFKELTHSQQIDITFQTEIANSIPSAPFQLLLLSNVNYQYDTDTSNNSAQNSVYAINPFVYFGADITLSQTTQTDTSVEIDGQVQPAELIGGIYSNEINLVNQGPNVANDVVLRIISPDSVQLFGFNIQPTSGSADTLFWTFNEITPTQQIDFTFMAEIANSIPYTPFELPLESSVFYPFDTNTANNSALSTVYAIDHCASFVPEAPLIEVSQTIVEVGDSVEIRVWIPNGVVSGELLIHYIDGSIVKDFSFIGTLGQQWASIVFTNTRLLTSAENEDIVFEFRTTDICGNVSSAQVSITLQSSNDCKLDRNVFIPETEASLGILFKLSSNRDARIDLYDITGYHIMKITEGPFNAGWNTYEWRGRTEQSQPVGSGVYIITVRSGELDCVLKVIIAR